KTDAKKHRQIRIETMSDRTLTNQEFFSHQVNEKIAQEDAEASQSSCRRSATTSTWWTIPRLLWAGTLSLAVFLVCTLFVVHEKTPTEESSYLTQILNARVDPVVSPNATVSMFEVKQDRVTVLWTEGLQSLPADYAAK